MTSPSLSPALHPCCLTYFSSSSPTFRSVLTFHLLLHSLFSSIPSSFFFPRSISSFSLPPIHALLQPFLPLIWFLLLFYPFPFIALIIISPDKLSGCVWLLLCFLTRRDSGCASVCADLRLYACGLLSICVWLYSGRAWGTFGLISMWKRARFWRARARAQIGDVCGDNLHHAGLGKVCRLELESTRNMQKQSSK